MTDKADHIAWAAEAIAVFQQHCRTGDEHAIADTWLRSAASTLSVRSGEGLGIGTRNIMLKTATISARVPQSRSRSIRGSCDPVESTKHRRRRADPSEQCLLSGGIAEIRSEGPVTVPAKARKCSRFLICSYRLVGTGPFKPPLNHSGPF